MSATAPTLLSAPRCIWDARARLGEGTLWSPSGQCLYWVDILGKQLHRYIPGGAARDGTRTTWSFDDEISAIAERRDHSGLVAAFRHGFAFFDPAQAPTDVAIRPSYLHEPERDRTANRFNDGKCDAQGRFWAGSMDFACTAPTGALYRYDPDGHCVRADDGFSVTNGPTWSADGRTLYFNDTVKRRVMAYDFEATNGTLANKRPWLRFADDDGFPDGMTTDAAGRLWIAHWGAGCVTCHDPVSGAELARIALPASQITNCTFGGPDLRTLYITSARDGLTAEQLEAQPLAGGLFEVEVDAAGVPANLFAG